MKEQVFWENSSYKSSPRLTKDLECDYLVVGGGVTGISTAYFLKRYGAKKVVLIEKNKIASGATGRAAGILTPNTELDLKDIKNYMEIVAV